MKKIIWHSGLPKKDGVYWFDNGKIYSTSTFLHILSGRCWFIGDGGSCPLEMVYSSEIHKKVRYSNITKPKKWDDLSCIREKKTLAWVKSPRGYFGADREYLGFGIFNPGNHNDVGGCCAWITHPQDGFTAGFWWPKNNGFLFSPILKEAK